MSEANAQSWVGCDPGGSNCFGIAFLRPDGSFRAHTVGCVQEALQHVTAAPAAVGVDSPLWWSAGQGGGRHADSWIRETYGISSGTVQSVNSLRGAAIAQGPLFISLLRQKFGKIPATEAHPKALLLGLGLGWGDFIQRYEISGDVADEHQRDAVIAAVAAREGFSGRWPLDLATARSPQEQDPSTYWLAPIRYFWPAVA